MEIFPALDIQDSQPFRILIQKDEWKNVRNEGDNKGLKALSVCHKYAILRPIESS